MNGPFSYNICKLINKLIYNLRTSKIGYYNHLVGLRQALLSLCYYVLLYIALVVIL